SQSSVDSVLIAADQTGTYNTGSGSFLIIDLSLGMTNPGTNAVPSLDGQRAAANLLNKHWTVFYHLPPVGTPDISAVSIPAVSSNSVKITWTTDVASDSTVYYSTGYSSSGGSYASYTDPASVTSHSVTVSGLTAATDYYFFVRSASGGLTGTSG